MTKGMDTMKPPLTVHVIMVLFVSIICFALACNDVEDADMDTNCNCDTDADTDSDSDTDTDTDTDADGDADPEDPTVVQSPVEIQVINTTGQTVYLDGYDPLAVATSVAGEMVESRLKTPFHLGDYFVVACDDENIAAVCCPNADFIEMVTAIPPGDTFTFNWSGRIYKTRTDTCSCGCYYNEMPVAGEYQFIADVYRTIDCYGEECSPLESSADITDSTLSGEAERFTTAVSLPYTGDAIEIRIEPDDSNGAQILVSQESTATDISIDIWCGVWGCQWEPDEDAWTEGSQLVDTATMETEGEFTPSYGHKFYWGIATAAGHFTEVFDLSEGTETTVDLDAVPEAARGIAGTMIATQYGYEPNYSRYSLRFMGPGGELFDVTPDVRQRFAVANLAPGAWTLEVFDPDSDWDMDPITFEVQIDDTMQYRDLVFMDPLQLD